MLHLVAHAVSRTLLFHTWSEARDLWLRLVALGPPRAVVLMPDHVHLMVKKVDLVRGYAVLSGYAHWRNRHHGQTGGRVWSVSPPPLEIPEDERLRRMIRYVLLNPCRAGLCTDPLAWPFSTHRDTVGLAVPVVRKPAPNPGQFHRYVSGDPSVSVASTPMPTALATPDPAAVVAAVSALARMPVACWDTSARDLAAAVLRDTLKLSNRAVARVVPVSRATVSRVLRADPSEVARVLQVAGDPRFPALVDTDLRRLPAWQHYLRVRAERRRRRSPTD